jgi:hypothetical protein
MANSALRFSFCLVLTAGSLAATAPAFAQSAGEVREIVVPGQGGAPAIGNDARPARVEPIGPGRVCGSQMVEEAERARLRGPLRSRVHRGTERRSGRVSGAAGSSSWAASCSEDPKRSRLCGTGSPESRR